MATITSAQSGDFSSPTTWVGGIVPGVGDTALVTTGHTVQITGEVTCGAIRCEDTTGYFALTDGAILNANVTGGARQTYFGTLLLGNPNTPAVINGNIIADYPGSNFRTVMIDLVANGGELTINGNIVGGPSSGSYAFSLPSTYANLTAGYTITVNGNVDCGATTTSSGIYIQSETSMILAINGDINENSAAVGNAVYMGPGSGNILAITGNIRGASTANTYSVHSLTSVAVTVTGDLLGSSAAGIALFCNGSGAVTVNGDVYAPAVDTAGNPTLRVDSGTGNLTVNGSLVANLSGADAVNTSGRNTIFTGGTTGSSDYPAPADVRSGVAYNFDTQTGTCAVPAAQSVSYGVAVDDTTGTAALDLGVVAAVLGAQIAAATSSPTPPA